MWVKTFFFTTLLAAVMLQGLYFHVRGIPPSLSYVRRAENWLRTRVDSGWVSDELLSSSVLPISVVMIDHTTPATFEATLATYDEHRFFNMISDAYLYVQEIDLYPKAVLARLRDTPFRAVLGSLKNTFIHGALSALFDVATQPYVLVLEKDFQLVESEWETRRLLSESIRLMRDRRLSVVRLKSRRAPGSPEFARRVVGRDQELQLFDRKGLGGVYNQRDLICQTLYWLNDTAFEQLLNASGSHWGIHRCGDSGEFWCFPPEYCHWTNQAVLVDRRWWLRNMATAVRKLTPVDNSFYQQHNALEIAARYSYSDVRWLTGSSQATVAVSSGLFSHRDMEKYPYDISVDE